MCKWVSWGWDLVVVKALFLPEAPGKNPFPYLFQLPEAPTLLGLWPLPSSEPAVASFNPWFCHHIFLLLSASLSHLQRPLWLSWAHHLDNPGSSPHLRVLSLVKSAKPLLAWKVTRIRMGTSVGAIIHPAPERQPALASTVISEGNLSSTFFT